MTTYDKDFCSSSYLAYRYIECDDYDFAEGCQHSNFIPLPSEKRIPVKTADDIDREIKSAFDSYSGRKLGLLLSGGMDSACLASYMPGGDAYTFRFLGGRYQADELKRAESFAKAYGLRLHYVDITWETVLTHVDSCINAKGAPVHSIEPQLLQAALQAKDDGIEVLVVGESADLVFGGMDQLLSRDWTLQEFKERYYFTDPKMALANPVDMGYLFERYRIADDGIDFLAFMDDVFSIESSSSYLNAFAVAEMPYFDPYAGLIMADPLDLDRVRGGEPKYLIRNLFAKKYPELPIPNKTPMPRPVDDYFKNWGGPSRDEFLEGLDMSSFTGNQKWQLWCLERFLNTIDSK